MVFLLSEICYSFISIARQKETNIKNQEYFKNLREKKIEHTDKTEAPNKSEDNPDTTVTLMSLETEQLLLAKLENFEKTSCLKIKSFAFLCCYPYRNEYKIFIFYYKKYKGKDFTTYINELRINYILEKLNTEPVYRQYKISTLAEDAGFSSHSKFATILKVLRMFLHLILLNI